MSNKSVTGFLDRLPAWSYFLLILVYLILMTFQGIDMADEGFNSIFFQQIYNDPGSVQYSFMFWLAGVVGGAFETLFPSFGFLGFRILGALVMTATTIVTYQLLKDYIKKPYLMVGLTLAVLIISNNIRIFHYNYLCTFFFMCEASLLFRGLKQNKPLYIFFAGAIVTLEVFTRIPSLVNVGMVVAIFYYAWQKQAGWAKPIRQSLIFLGGFVFALVAVLGIMHVTGQLTIFRNALSLVVEMGKGGEGSHYGLSKLIRQFFMLHAISLKTTLLVLLSLIVAILAANYVRLQSFHRPWMTRLAGYAAVLCFVGLIVVDRIDHISVLYILTNVCLFSAVFLLTSRESIERKTLMLIGCYIILTYPLGSSDGMVTVGVYTLWLALPIATHFIFCARHIENRLQVTGERKSSQALLVVSTSQLSRLRNYFFGLALFACLWQAYFYPFFDRSNRIDMRYQVDNKYMKGVFTTQSRATAINELLQASSQYVKPGDKVLAYHSIPLFHYMTETKPYLRNSMPWLYEGGFFKKELNETAAKRDTLPVIVKQLLKTVGDASNWPDPPKKYDETWDIVNKKRDDALNEFIATHGYTEVWRNKAFSILVPGR